MAYQSEIDAILASTRTKSAKIRALAEMGVTKKQIAHMLAINANHVYSIIARDRANERRGPPRDQAKPGEGDVVQMVGINASGELVVSRQALEVMAVPPGEQVVLLAYPGEIRLLTRAKAVAKIQESLQSQAPGEAALAGLLLKDIGE